MGDVVNHNYQMCDVTNKPILDMLGGRKPQVTFDCDKASGECDFQCKHNLSHLLKVTCARPRTVRF